MIPEEIKKQIEGKSKEQGSGFVITTFSNGAEFGYSLAAQEISSLNEILSQKMELLVKANERIEELEKLVNQAFNSGYSGGYCSIGRETTWEQFKTENNL